MDRTLELLSTYAGELTYEALPAEVVHQVKRTLPAGACSTSW